MTPIKVLTYSNVLAMENLTPSKVLPVLTLESFKKILPSHVVPTEDSFTLNLDNKIGEGSIHYTNLNFGLKVFDLDLILSKNTAIPLSLLSLETLQFIYCLQGSFVYRLETSEASAIIEQFQTTVSHSDHGILNSLHVKAHERVKLNIIFVDKEEYFKKNAHEPDELGIQLKEILLEIGSQDNYFHEGSYNLKIAEELKQLKYIKHTQDVCEKLSQKGRYYIILAKQIEQFYNEINNSANNSSLLKYELGKVVKVAEHIQQYPEIQHSIKSLCRLSNLSPAKLQVGFKHLYNRTVSDFVRNTRLEKAEHLLKTTDLTISEIVYTIGLTSRSYFCKIFKNKHLCNPKHYRKKIRN